MFWIAQLFVSILCFTSVLGIPSWDGGFGTQPTTSIGSLVPGAGYLEALGPVSHEQYRPKYLSVTAPRGVPGNAVIFENPSPPLFYVNKNQLWQVTNQTSILQANLLNVTATHPVPLKLVFGDKPEGLSGGTWRWQATRLFYDLGSRSNDGLFYQCQLKDGSQGVYMSLEPMATPAGCKYVTLHNFVRRM